MNTTCLLLVFLLATSFIIGYDANQHQQRCKAPAKTIPNGKRSSLNVHEFRIGSIVRYWCESGYAVKGGRYLKCVLRNGRTIWAGSIPTCVREGRYAGGSSRSHSGSGSHSGSSKGPVPNSSAAGYTNRQSKCTAPAKTIPNGKRSSFNINHFKIGSVVRYWCESGYAVKGGRYLKCVLRNGKGIWAGNIPTCVKVNSNQRANSRSHSDSDSHSDSTSGSISTRIGSSRIRCPTHKLNNGWVKITYYRAQGGVSLAQYYCKRGWRLHGRARRVCRRNGVWFGPLPECQRPTVKDCGDPGSPVNGGRHLSSTVKGSIVKFYCKSHHKLVGCSKRICTDKGWSGIMPYCKAIQCFPLSRPRYGSISLSKGRSVLSTATYACSRRFKLYGDKVRTCLGTGKWTGIKPVCKCDSCGDLSTPYNGLIKYYSSRPGAKAVYQCNKGYDLIGTWKRTCQRNCVWSGNEPVCEKNFAKCKPLESPSNGKVTVKDRKPGSVAYYSCNEGYRLIGYDRRECLEKGVWSMEAPTCQAINCDSLNPPINGGVNLTGAAFRSSAFYYCFPGYSLVGEATRHCEESGVWSGVPPICQVVDCGILPNPSNGSVDFEDTVFESVATYACHVGFELSGDETRICSKGGEWLGVMPSCEPIECGDLDDPLNGEVNYEDAVFNSIATYSCFFGYELIGISKRVCKEDGLWSGNKPSCKVIDCGELSPPVNGFIKYKESVFESIATYSCKQGYDLVGDVMRLCDGSGLWSGSTPVCEAVDCGPLNAPINGEVDVEETTLGSVASYSCLIGYLLSDDESRVCQPSGVWSGEEPICEGLEGGDCRLLTNPVGGSVALSGTAVGSRAEYSCNEGYNLSEGDKLRFCLETLHWSGEEAACEAVSCPILEDPENGHVSFQSVTFRSEATYFCEQGYTISGPAVRTCGPDGKWTNEQPTCDSIDCGSLSNPPNGLVNYQSTTFLSVARYNCSRGFELMGNEARECMANGQWSGDIPICTDAERCVPLSNPPNGIVEVDGMKIKGSTASYSCNFGFSLVGDNQRVCQGSASGWSGAEPTCIVIECPILPNPSDGLVSFDERTVFSLATYSCNEGFFLVGLNTRECKSNGEWSIEIPFCQKVIDCGVLVNIDFGMVQFNDTSEGSVAVYTCSMGYTLEGGNERVCQEDGQWSGREPVCSIIDCGPLTAPDNGKVLEMGTLLGDTATYQCDDGFNLVGEKMRYCQANGFWAGNEPFCEVVEVREACVDPGALANGVRTGNDLTVGSAIFYRCNDGFILMGSKVRVCQENGVFSGMQPKCEPFNDHCQGSSTVVFDQCNRKCECVNKRIVKCSRLRRDWSELNIEDRLRYIAAIKFLATDELYRPRYEALVKQYQESFDTDAQVTEPSISQFIPYNRHFLLQYENLLREIDCRITIPYWDWTAFPVRPYQNPVWDNAFGFGNTSRPSDSCVTTGPFKSSEFLVPDGKGEYVCVRRNYNVEEFPRREAIERDILPLPALQFRRVHQQLQLFVGLTVLCYVGGDLCSSRSAYDPVYLLYVSYIDFVFNRWQSIGDGRESIRYGADGMALVFGRGLVVSEFSDNKNLPGGVTVSYGVPVFHKNHTPPFLQRI